MLCFDTTDTELKIRNFWSNWEAIIGEEAEALEIVIY